jgi:hypothetical protein
MRLQITHLYVLPFAYLQLRYKMSARRHFRSCADMGRRSPAPLRRSENRARLRRRLLQRRDERGIMLRLMRYLSAHAG